MAIVGVDDSSLGGLKAGTHCPCSRSLFTGREHGQCRQAPVITARVDGCQKRQPSTRAVILDTRVQGPAFTSRVEKKHCRAMLTSTRLIRSWSVGF